MTLHELIPMYAMNKSELDSYDKLVKKEGQQIKDIMLEEGLTEAESNGYVVKRIIQKREVTDENVMLDIAHMYDLGDIIKVKEYIDYDELERQIYSGRIPNDIVALMSKAVTTKEVVVLKISKKKEKDNG